MQLNIKAKYRPKNKDNISSKMNDASTKDLVYTWEFAFYAKCKLYYSTNSILFPTTMPVCIDNLDIQE